MATITEVGTGSGVVKYTGDFVMYTPKTMICYFHPVKTDRVGVNCGSHYQEWVFDNETQRDSAITTLLALY